MEENINELCPAETERLAILAEECSEVIQMVGKILRHGYMSYHPDDKNAEWSNRRLLEKEIGHVQYIISTMVRNNDVNATSVNSFTKDKQLDIWQYLHHQENTL